jgi:hypothetical protein
MSKFVGGPSEAEAIIKAINTGKKRPAKESVEDVRVVRCPLCGGPAISMQAGGYRCGNPPCEWVSE